MNNKTETPLASLGEYKARYFRSNSNKYKSEDFLRGVRLKILKRRKRNRNKKTHR